MFLKEWLNNIVYISIFSVFIEIIVVGDATKKLIRLTTGFIIILVMISPVTKWIFRDLDLGSRIVEQAEQMDQLTDKNRQNLKSQFDSLVAEQSREMIKEKMALELQSRLEDLEVMDLKISLDYEGKVTECNVILSPKENDSNRHISEIRQIDIRVDESAENSRVDKELESQIKSALQSYFTKDVKLTIYIG